MVPTDFIRKAKVPAALTDIEGRVVLWNDKLQEITGVCGEAARRRDLVTLLRPYDVFGNPTTWLSEDFANRFAEGELLWPFEVDLLGVDGGPLRVACSVVVFVRPNGPLQLGHFLKPIRQRRRSDVLMDWLLRHWEEARTAAPKQGATHASRVASSPAEWDELTLREREVLRQLAAAKTNEAIADVLGISVHTVRTHVRNILRKLDSHSRLEAVSVAFRLQAI